MCGPPLNDVDEQILEELREGRVTPRLLQESDEIDSKRSYISQRLTRLHEHGVADRLVTGLYELKNDPAECDDECD